MDTVQALVCVGAVTAFVSTLRMAHTLKKQAFPFHRDAFSIKSSPLGPSVRARQPGRVRRSFPRERWAGEVGSSVRGSDDSRQGWAEKKETARVGTKMGEEVGTVRY